MALYQWLTRRAYGEIEPYQVGRYKRVTPVAPSRLRPDVPIWLDHIVLKAIARDPKQRFETAEEMLLALKAHGALAALVRHCGDPLVGRDPLVLWQAALLFRSCSIWLLIYWLTFLPRR